LNINLSGRAAVVTGRSEGIGFAVATRFAASGADVAIIARSGEPLKEGVAAIRKSSQSRVIGVQADVSKPADIQRAYDEVMKAFDDRVEAVWALHCAEALAEPDKEQH
jgi:NAD(P)-dependent dehydrogenase (short-subunit alcohol dehydrogenase family)